MCLAKKQAVKAKESSEVSTWAKITLSDVLSAHCIYVIGCCIPAERKFVLRNGIASGENG